MVHAALAPAHSRRLRFGLAVRDTRLVTITTLPPDTAQRRSAAISIGMSKREVERPIAESVLRTTSRCCGRRPHRVAEFGEFVDENRSHFTEANAEAVHHGKA